MIVLKRFTTFMVNAFIILLIPTIIIYYDQTTIKKLDTHVIPLASRLEVAWAFLWFYTSTVLNNLTNWTVATLPADLTCK